MPFTLRTVQPVFVSRAKLTGADGKPKVTDNELEAVFNFTLCSAIRQLASLVEAADDVFGGLSLELRAITDRASTLQGRIIKVKNVLEASDPRLITVPEGDLCAFAATPRDKHFRSEGARGPRGPGGPGGPDLGLLRLFVPETRPHALRRMYELAARPALGAEALDQLDRLRRDGARSSALFLCTPTMGRSRASRLRRKVVDIDIETRKPASLMELRKWTSTEALGDITVHPDCTVRIAASDSVAAGAGEEVDGGEAGGDDNGGFSLGESTLHDQTDHLLPTTEEQVKAIADRFPPQIVRMDVTGRSFQRMTQYRRSLIHPGRADEEARRRPRPRRQRSRRRNTIAGTDQKELEEALHGPGDISSTAATVDDIILSSSTMLDSNPKNVRETSADFKKWAFNSLKRWGKSRLRAISTNNSSTSSNIVPGDLHAADPVDDINVYETVAGKRRGAGNIPISAGLSGPISLAVKLRESSLGQRRLKITDEPPHSSSGNWSASSESGRASVNSDSSHQPKSSVCSSVLPHRRRFINTSTSSSVTSEGTLTPEDMAAVPFSDDGETSSVYSCDTEGYYTSFHMDSGLKTLKEEEVGAGLSLPPTPMHSTSALSNCSSGRGSASLAQLTAESEYELFGRGSTSTTASSAGTVCTTLLADNSRGCDNSNGSDRSLSKGPAVPERKSSLTVPCLAQECPPCSTVVALIHNTSQGHSPRSSTGSGGSPDSGHNTSSSPIESVSCQHDTETDAFISPLPSIASEMEFSECSDFEGTDRIERIRVKTTINTSRIPSMCAITPPQSDDETNTRQLSEANHTIQQNIERAPFPLPNTTAEDDQLVRNDNYAFNYMTDNNANKANFDSNCNSRPVALASKDSLSSIIHVDKRSGYATIHTFDNASKENNNNQKVRPPSPSGGTLFINPAVEEVESMGQPLHQQPLIKDALIPFTNMLSKFRKASNLGKKLLTDSSSSTLWTKNDPADSSHDNDESGEYVTITDVRNNNKPNVLFQCTPQSSEISEPARESTTDKAWESLEYVSLNELPVSTSSEFQPSSVLSGSFSESSLERRKRQGARVTLDSEGKVVYSSDSLRRRKGAHTTFAPGQCVKDTLASPSPSPVANHRTPKAIIRPVHSQSSGGLLQDSRSKSPVKTNSRSTGSNILSSDSSALKLNASQISNGNRMKVVTPQNLSRYPANLIGNRQNERATSLSQSQDLINQRNKVIIRAGIASPTKDLVRNSALSSLKTTPTPSSRGAYVHVRTEDRPSIQTNPMFLQTDFDGPDDSISPRTIKNPGGISPQPLGGAQNQPIYQNASLLSRHRGKMTSNQPYPQLIGNQYQQPVQTSASPNRVFSPSVPSRIIDAPLHSSTPTKPDSTSASPLTVGNTFSPIEKDVPQPRLLLSSSQAFLREQGNRIGADEEKPQSPQDIKPSLVLAPKTTMTAEELYAKIHKSKKKMKIKCEPGIVLSPTSSVGSQSPVSSERSESPAGANDPRTVARSRHSWSPNSSKYLDIASSFDPRSSTPSPNPRPSKDHGLTQVTSTQDFKRLLLQHGSGTTGRSKISAVERLKQAKQMASSVLSQNAPKFRFGTNSNACSSGQNFKARSGSTPIQPVAYKPVPNKSALLKPGPKLWRFVAHKNDVRSTPIMEDQREDEVASGGFEIQTLSSSPMPARNLVRNVPYTHSTQEKHETIPVSSSCLGARPEVLSTPLQLSLKSNTSQPPPNFPSMQTHKAATLPKQLRFGQTQFLPTAVQSGPHKSVDDLPTALETAL